MLPSEHLHWLYAAAFLMLGLLLLAHAIVGDEIWNHRTSRRYSWPGLGFAMGVLLWPAVVLPMRSTIDLLAHWAWAETTMLAGAAHLALAQGKLRSRYWRLTMPLALGASGFAFLAHERRGWLSGRSPFVHHLCAWTLIAEPFSQWRSSFTRGPLFSEPRSPSSSSSSQSSFSRPATTDPCLPWVPSPSRAYSSASREPIRFS